MSILSATMPMPPGYNDTLERLERFLEAEKPKIAAEIRSILRADLKDLRRNPDFYRESPDAKPSIDIRLCVDVERSGRGFHWLLRTGSADYDQRHSEWSGAGSFGLETDAVALTEELIGQVGE